MTINLKPINIYNEFDPYDIDVDNRPLLDIQSNITDIVKLLETQGFYSEISPEPSQEPPGGFTVFTCACVYTNNLLVPIDISKSTAEVNYSSLPIVLVIGYNEETKRYKCIFFSAGIALTNKFSSFVPGSQGRLLRIGPGGELVDQLYYDLAHAGKNYQALYVGKILSANSIVFGGNQVSILGNNYYLGKNRDDSSSGVVTIQRDNADSNTVFNAVSINSVGSTYTYAEYINNLFGTTSGVPIYFSGTRLDFDQSTGSFLTSSLETKLNELHFSTPFISTFNSSTQTYLTAGVNINSLLTFSAVNLLHASAYSNSILETTQSLSTKLVFQNRITDLSIPIGVSLNSVIKYIGNTISLINNQPEALLPTEDTTGITIADYFNTAGAYIGGVQDNSALSSIYGPRMTEAVDLVKQKNANFTTNGINDYSDSFTLVIATKSKTSIPSNITITTDGYLNLSSTLGTLVNKLPTLDAEVTPKRYVDLAIKQIAESDSNKIPMTGTDVKDVVTGTVTPTPITGKLFIDVSNNAQSTSTVLQFLGVNSAEVVSTVPVHFREVSGGTYQTLYSYNLGYTDSGFASITPGSYEVVTKGYLLEYVNHNVLAGDATFVKLVDPQTITGLKTFSTLVTSIVAQADPSIRLLTSTTGAIPAEVSVDNFGTVEINGNNSSKPSLVLARSTADIDTAKSVTTKDWVEGKIAGVTAAAVVPFYAIWTHINAPGFLVTSGSLQYSCRFNSSSDGGNTDAKNFANFFEPTAAGLKYKGPNDAVFQVNAGVGWYQNLGSDQYRTSCHILVNDISHASVYDQFDGPSGFSARPGSTVSAVIKLNTNDILVIGAKVNSDLTGTMAIDHYLSMARIG